MAAMTRKVPTAWDLIRQRARFRRQSAAGTSAPQVVIADPGCSRLAGHHYTSVKVLEAATAPLTPRFVIAAKASETLDLPAARTFRLFDHDPYMLMNLRSMDPAQRRRRRRFRSLPQFDGTAYQRNLKRLFDKISLGPHDHLVFPTTTPDIVLSALALVADGTLRDPPVLHFRFLWHDRPGDGDLWDRALRALAAAMRAGLPARIHAQTPPLATRLGESYGFSDVGLALLRYPYEGRSVREEPADADRVMKIGCLGDSRPDKGIERYGAIFKAILQHNAALLSPHEFRFVVQVPRRPRRFVQELRDTLDTEAPRLSFVGPDLSIEEFGQVLAGCDLVLLPYDREAYLHKNSGVLFDAVMAGVPAVCPTGTALCSFVETGNGLVASSDREFAAAAMRIIGQPAPFRAAAARLATVYRDEWRTNALVTELRAAAGKS